MAEPKKKSAVVTARAKNLTTLPAGILGFSALIVPDEYEGKESFKLNIHYTPEGIEQLKASLQKGMDLLLPEIEKAAKEQGANMKPTAPQSVEDWLEDQLKEVTDQTKKITLPFLKLKCPAHRKGNESRGEPEKVPVVVKAWPAHGNTELALKKLRLGMGSLIAPIVYINLFRSKQGKDCPQLTLKLVGFRVITLKQFGSAGQPPEESDDAAIKAALGGEVDETDLSMFLAGGDAHEEADGDDTPDGDSPEDLARKMFG